MSRLITLAKTNRKEFKRFSKFLAVGLTGFVVDFGIFNLLIRALNFPPVLAQAISFTMAAINNFLWNRYWTYPESKAHPFLSQYFQFFIINAMALLIRLPILTFLPSPFKSLIDAVLHTSSATTEVLANNAALAVAVAIAMFWNFFVNRLVTYRHIKVGQ